LLLTGLQDLPRFPTSPGCDAVGYLGRLCADALPVRYGAVGEPVTHQLRYELQVIGQAGLANYLLIVWDLVRFARSQGIRCQGRGSAANSLVAYLLGIGPIDPLRHQPVFERFLSAERPTLPGIDLGVDAARTDTQPHSPRNTSNGRTLLSPQATSDALPSANPVTAKTS